MKAGEERLEEKGERHTVLKLDLSGDWLATEICTTKNKSPKRG
jgi:hypothetical protein